MRSISSSSTIDITEEIPYRATLIAESMEKANPNTGIWKVCVILNYFFYEIMENNAKKK